MIACVLIRHFPVAVEWCDGPSRVSTPLVLHEHARVFGYSAEAEKAEVEAGMTLRQAEALCPQAHFLPARPRRYQEAFQALAELLLGFSPAIEASDWQPHATSFADLGRARESDYVESVQEIGQAVRERL
jgi:nucleotidyltransferase/DNA polymerase involved in DNA repair